MSKVYFEDWGLDDEQKAREQVLKDFQAPDDALNDAEVLFAAYTYADYNGDALVVYRKDGKLFEVNGGHCSCYGLENQWEPEETSGDALRKRDPAIYAASDQTTEALKALIATL